LADWLLSLSREQLLWLLDKKRVDWSKDSDCFMRDHDGQIRRLESRHLNLLTVLQLHGIAPEETVAVTGGSPTEPDSATRGNSDPAAVDGGAS
jgi:hypothetical protein